MSATVISVASRRIPGLLNSVRFDLLHIMSAAHFFRNLCLQYRANFRHSELMGHDAGIRTGVRGEMGVIVKVGTVDLAPHMLR